MMRPYEEGREAARKRMTALQSPYSYKSCMDANREFCMARLELWMRGWSDQLDEDGLTPGFRRKRNRPGG